MENTITEEQQTQEVQEQPTAQAVPETQPEQTQEQPNEDVDKDGKSKSERERDAHGFEERQKRKERDLEIRQAVLEEQEKRLKQGHLTQPQQQVQQPTQYTPKVAGGPASYGYVYNPNVPPLRDNFINEDTYEIDEIAYVNALTEHTRRSTVDAMAIEEREKSQQQRVTDMVADIERKEAEYMAANPDSDYMTVVNAAMPLIKTLDHNVVDAIFSGDNPCDVMYKVASDPKVINRLKSNNPIQVGMELSNLQNSVKTAGRVVSSASEPPPNPKTSVSSSGKSKNNMSRSEYYAKRREELGMTR